MRAIVFRAAMPWSLPRKLRTLPQIQHVNYVGLEDNPYHELAQRQFGKTAGAMICIDLEDEEACFSFLNNLKLIHRATNLFDNRSLRHSSGKHHLRRILREYA